MHAAKIRILFIGSLLFFSRLSFGEVSPVLVQASINKLMDRISDQFGVRVLYKNVPQTSWHSISFEQASDKDLGSLLKYLLLIEGEFKKYPKTLLEKSGLRDIVLVKKLFLNKDTVEGAYDFRQNIIFLDFLRSSNSLDQRHNFHHEMFHVIEYQKRHHSPGTPDPDWSGLNPSDFLYGRDNFSSRKRKQWNYFAPVLPGFVTFYSLSAVDEDKAEVFACLFIESQSKLVHEWMKKDEILKNKVKYLKNFLYQFCEDFNEEFWKKLFFHPNKENSLNY